MEHYVGIDVSLERSSVCVVDATGRVSLLRWRGRGRKVGHAALAICA